MNHIPAQTTILIVDDDASLRRTLALIFQHKGYTVETADDGVQAVERVCARPFDMILMDIRMPVLDGVRALRQIKAIRPQAAVTMMTAYAVEDLIQDALAEGAFALLTKPIEIEQVIAFVEQSRQGQQGKLIMIVDDDQATRTALQSVLGKKGYRVCTACSGEEAIARARETAYDILLIDLHLPALNGLETYLAIKEISPLTVAIIFTAFPRDMAQLAEQAISHNAYACLYKPLDIDRLLDLVQEIANKKLR